MDAKEYIKKQGIIFQQDGTCCLQKEWLIKHLTEFASQQPTEKTREGAIEILKKGLNPNNHIYVEGIIDTLIQSGYIQSDSVDAEQIDIFTPCDNYKDSATQTLKSWVEKGTGKQLFTDKEIAFIIDKLSIYLSNPSKVKPVNEITEALKDLIQQIKYPSRGSSDKHGKMIATPNIVRAELALSTAPESNHPDK